MYIIKQKGTARNFLLAGLLLACICGYKLVSSYDIGTLACGATLTSADLVATIGNGTCPCKKEYKCTQGFVTGGSQCSYCEAGVNSEWVCCNLGTTNDCTYNGGTSKCNVGTLWSGPKVGTAGTCDTCNGDVEEKQVKCTGRVKATGTAC